METVLSLQLLEIVEGDSDDQLTGSAASLGCDKPV